MAPPDLDDDLRLTQCVEDLAVEELVAQARIEAFDVEPGPPLKLTPAPIPDEASSLKRCINVNPLPQS
jgi:hypothetical protein